MIVLGILLFKYAYHVCDHQNAQSQYRIETVAPTLGDFAKIRIKFDTQAIDGTDSKRCTNTEQITWNNKTYTCQEKDKIKENQKNALTTTFNNIKTYFSDTLKVKQVKSTFFLKNYSDWANVDDQTQSAADADLQILVYLRPFGGENHVARTAIVAIHSDTKQPIQAMMAINVKKIPESANERFEHIILHETLHALGISSLMYKNYHPISTNDPHANTTCKSKHNGYEQSYLITPNAHLLAQYRWGISKIGSCWSGIELENSEGIEMSHPEFRRFYSDMLTGFNIEKPEGLIYRMSDVTLAILKDTGFYEVDYTKFRPMVWMNSFAVTGERNPDYGLKIPNTVFPPNYILNIDNLLDRTGFDFQCATDISYYNKAGEWMNTSDCSNESSSISREFCDHESFYNPAINRYSYAQIYNEPAVDFAQIKLPLTMCETGKAIIPTNRSFVPTDSGTALCGAYNCKDDDSSFTFTLPNGTEITCDKEHYNSSDYVAIYHDSHANFLYWCPDPKQFCKTRKLLKQTKFDKDPFENVPPPIDPQPSSGSSSPPNEGDKGDSGKPFDWNLFIIIIVCVGVAIFCIIIIALAIWYRKKRQKRLEEEEDQEDYYSSSYSSGSI